MLLRGVILLLASAMGGGLTAMADPPTETSSDAWTLHAPFDLASVDRPHPGDPPAMAPDRTPMWGRGQILPPEFRGEEFTNWEAYHLSVPPEGYHWVRVERGVYRVKQEDGFIAEAVFGLPAD